MIDLLEIFKMAIPALASSSVVAYYYQKRLKRIGSFEAITNTLLQRLIEGASDVHWAADDLRYSVASITKLVAADDMDLIILTEARVGGNRREPLWRATLGTVLSDNFQHSIPPQSHPRRFF